LLLLSQLASFWNFAFRRFAGRRQGEIECAQRKLAPCERAALVAVEAEELARDGRLGCKPRAHRQAHAPHAREIELRLGDAVRCANSRRRGSAARPAIDPTFDFLLERGAGARLALRSLFVLSCAARLRKQKANARARHECENPLQMSKERLAPRSLSQHPRTR
jgi:hypothetical protein